MTTKSDYHVESFQQRQTGYLIPQIGLDSWVPVGERNFSLGGEITYGANVPNYRTLLAKGLNATTTLSGSEKRCLGFRPGSMTVHFTKPNTQLVNRVRGYLGPTTSPPSMSFSTGLYDDALNQAKSRFMKQLISAQNSFKGSTALGELRETISMVLHPAKTLRGSVNSYFARLTKAKQRFPRNNRNHRRSRKQVLADTYLEYAFGWAPTVQDTIDALGLLLVTVQRPEFKPISVTGKAADVSYTNWVTTSSSTLCRYKSRLRELQTILVSFRGVVGAELFGGTYSTDFTREWGFTLQEFLPTAWELAPYSFLFDYFSNIQEIVEGVSYARSGLRWSNWTVIKSKTTDVSVIPGPIQEYASSYGVTRIDFSHPTFTLTAKNIARETYTGNFIPSLEFEVPGYDSRKWLNIAALISSARKLEPFY